MPRKTSKSNKVDTTLRLPPQIREAVKMTADELGLDDSEVLRAAIISGLTGIIDMAIKAATLKELIQERGSIPSERAYRIAGTVVSSPDLQKMAEYLEVTSDRIVEAIEQLQKQKEPKVVS